MNANEPVAWIDKETGCFVYSQYEYEDLDEHGKDGLIPLYTHEYERPHNTVLVPCDKLAEMQAEIKTLKAHPVKELTDEEINQCWAESHEDGIAMQQGFTTQQHYFANLILRKASEK
jgi:hypothetical protein